MRLDKYVSTVLNVSRDEARRLIKSGRIRLDLKKNIRNNETINEIEDVVYFDDKPLEYLKFVYIMLNKPAGYLSATFDEKEKTVLDLVSEYKGYDLSIAGRLDKDTEGLMILSNDGKLLHKLTSPTKNLFKKYYVEVKGEFKKEDVDIFLNGMDLYDGKSRLFKTKPAILEILDKDKAYISISEGKYHQIKKMCLKVNKEVTYLKRIAIGNLVLDETLSLGEYRLLATEEIKLLKEATNV